MLFSLTDSFSEKVFGDFSDDLNAFGPYNETPRSEEAIVAIHPGFFT